MTSTNFTPELFAIFQNRHPTVNEFNEIRKKKVKYLFTDYWVYQKKIFDYFDPVFRFDVGRVDMQRILRTHFPKDVVGEIDIRKFKQSNWLDITDERVFKILTSTIDAVVRRLTHIHKNWIPKIEIVGCNGYNYHTGFEIDYVDQVRYNNRFVDWFRTKWNGGVAVEYEFVWKSDFSQTLLFDALRIDGYLDDGMIDSFVADTTKPIFDAELCGNRISAFINKRLHGKWKRNHKNVNIVGINREDGTNYFHI